MSLIITDQAGNQYSLSVDQASGALLTAPVTNVTPSTGDNSIFRTALDIITRSLRLINVIAADELPTSDEANDGLEVFQEMVDAWNSESLAVYSITSNDYPLTLGQQTYTLGPGGNFDTNRPARIEGMSAILLSNPSNPVEVPIDMYTWEEWQTKLPVKTVDGTFPLVCYDDGGMPLRTLNFWPIPTQQPNNVRIYSWQPLIWPATLQTLINFPPGYARAFRYNLAVEEAAEFGAQIPPQVAQIATNTMAAIKTLNVKDLPLISDLVRSPSGYSWKADMFGIPY